MVRLTNILLWTNVILLTFCAYCYAGFRKHTNYIDIIEFVDSLFFLLAASLILVLVMKHKFKRHKLAVGIAIYLFYIRLFYFTNTLTLILGTDYFTGVLISHGLVGVIITLVNVNNIKIKLNNVFNSFFSSG
jgi:hypothetical protein